LANRYDAALRLQWHCRGSPTRCASEKTGLKETINETVRYTLIIHSRISTQKNTIMKSLTALISGSLKLSLLLILLPLQSLAQYCVPSGSLDCSDGDRATNVAFAGINHNPACNAATGYNDYTTSVAAGNIMPGSTYPIAVTVGGAPDYAAVWIDYDQDQTFEASEFLLLNGGSASAAGGQVLTGTINVPATASPGATRMRVRVKFLFTIASNNACALTGVYGEVTDYTVIIGSSSCSGTPTAGATNAVAPIVACNSTTALSLTGNTTGTGIGYQWQFNTSGSWINFGTNSPAQTSPAITQNTQFRCLVSCANGGGIAASAPVSVAVTPIAVHLGNDTTICPGINYILDAGNAGATYAWNTGATTQSIIVSTTGTYSVLVTTANGCTGSDTINIKPGAVPVNIMSAVTDLCEGSTVMLNAGNAGNSFLWSPGGSTAQQLNVTAGGNYTVAITSTDGCVLNSSTGVIVRPRPIPNLGNDTSICPGSQIVLDAGNIGSTYLWSTGDIVQTVTVADSGLYSVTINTPFNCSLSDSIYLAFLPGPYVEGFNFIPLFYEGLGKVRFSPLSPTNVSTYEWNFGDGSPSSTLENPEHTYSEGASYLVSLKVFNDCGDYITRLPINIDLPTGINPAAMEVCPVLLYPNPATDVITIRSRNRNLKIQEVLLYNTAGTLLYRQKSDTGNEHTLSVSYLTAGLYILNLLTDHGPVIQNFEVIR